MSTKKTLMNDEKFVSRIKKRQRQLKLKLMRKHWQLYLILLVPIVWLAIFRYWPIGGLIMAFKDYQVKLGMWQSPWLNPVLKNFIDFFSSPNFPVVLKNTLSLSLYGLIAGFPFPIIFALAINECGNITFKKIVQEVAYAPYFISMVIMVSILFQILNPIMGMVNNALTSLGIVNKGVDFIGDPNYFRHVYVWSSIWQYTGYSAIIYIAALSSIDPCLYDAAVVDGASKLQRIRHVDLPGIAPTIVILLIMSAGRIMNVGFEKVFLMQVEMNKPVSEIIQTYVYRIGIRGAQFSFATAVGLFNSVVNMVLIVIVNQVARRLGETSLW